MLCAPTASAADLTAAQKDFLKAVMDDLRKMGKGDIAVSLNQYISEGRVVFTEGTDASVDWHGTDPNTLEIPKKAPEEWIGLKNLTARYQEKGNSQKVVEKDTEAQVMIRSASLTMIHEEIHMGQDFPLQIPSFEDPAYEEQISQARWQIKEDMRKIQEILDGRDRLPGDQEKLNELVQDLLISRRAYMDMIGSFQDVIDKSRNSWHPIVTAEKFENATSDMVKLTKEAQDLINRAKAGFESAGSSAGPLGKIISTKGAFVSIGNVASGTDLLGFANCLCSCGCSLAGWACGSGAACGYLGSPLGDCICAGFGEGHAPIPTSGECYDDCARNYNITGTVSNKSLLSPAIPSIDNRIFPGRLIQTTGDTLILAADGSKLLAGPGSTLKFTSTRNGEIAVDLFKGTLRVAHDSGGSAVSTGSSGSIGSTDSAGRVEGLAVQVAGLTVQPLGTEFLCRWDGSSGKVAVSDGSVSISGEGSVETQQTLHAGEEMALPQGTVSDYHPASDEGGLVAGIPLSDLILEEGRPEPFGEYDAVFQDGAIPEGWVWQDPGSDAELEGSPTGGLKITVPDGNEFWGYPGVTALQRSDAPRLLHKVTGDFDLQGRVYIDTQATDLATVEFIYYSPGSYIGEKSGLMKRDLLGEHYNLPGGGWLLAGSLNKLPALGRPSEVTYSANSAELSSAPNAPDEPDRPVYLKFTRRGGVLKTYHSLDGESWTLSSREHVNISQTIWVGWVFKRIAYDGLTDRPSIVTLEDVRLLTAESGSLPIPQWDEILISGSARIDEGSIRLSLDGSERGTAAVQKGKALTGDFQATVTFQAENTPPQSGESRYLALMAYGSSGKNRSSMGWISDSGHVSPLYITEFLSEGQARGDGHDYTDDWGGRLRLVRQGGNISTYFWKEGDWKVLGDFQRGFSDPVYICLEVSNERQAAANASMTVDFTIDADEFNADEIDADEIDKADEIEGDVPSAPASQAGEDASPVKSDVGYPTDFAFEKWGAYSSLESYGRRYFTGYLPEATEGMDVLPTPLLWERSRDKSLMDRDLACEVLIDQDSEGAFTNNTPLNLSDGYQLHILSADAESGRAYLELTRYGEIVDSSTINADFRATVAESTYCYRTDLGSARDIAVIAVHFKNAFEAGVYYGTYDGIFQISSSPVRLEAAQ